MTIRRIVRGTEAVTIECDRCKKQTRVIGCDPTDHPHVRAIAARSGWSVQARPRDLCPDHGHVS